VGVQQVAEEGLQRGVQGVLCRLCCTCMDIAGGHLQRCTIEDPSLGKQGRCRRSLMVGWWGVAVGEPREAGVGGLLVAEVVAGWGPS
jgi:hypothetical protein